MKWPWVSIELLDEQIERANRLAGQVYALARHNESLASIIEADAKRYDALIEKYHALKVTGAAPSEPKPTLHVAKPSGPVADAIDDVCAKFGNSIKLRRRLMKYAEDAKKDAPDMDEDDIAHAILHWRDPDNDEDAA